MDVDSDSSFAMLIAQLQANSSRATAGTSSNSYNHHQADLELALKLQADEYSSVVDDMSLMFIADLQLQDRQTARASTGYDHLQADMDLALKLQTDEFWTIAVLRSINDEMEREASFRRALQPGEQKASESPGSYREIRPAGSNNDFEYTPEIKRFSRRPRYVRELIWSDEDKDVDRERLTLADATEHMPPLPSVPANEARNDIVLKTIRSNPHLFRIVTPINVDRFEQLLVTHPNRPFIDSVIHGLRHGFWPWADTSDSDLPVTLDRSDRYPIRDPEHLKFVCEQRSKEIEKGRFSPSFRTLLPGMHAVPVVVVPKPNSDKLRMTVHHSSKPFPLNSMIDKPRVPVPLDNLTDLGAALIRYRKRHGRNVRLFVWKSDVAEAYRMVPMNPHWQMKQVVKIDDEYNVDRCNNFGNRGAGGLFGRVIGPVAWIAKNVKGIEDVFTYVDDNFGFEEASRMAFYRKRGCMMPERQVRLLELWDELGVPHDAPKQLFGPVLRVIGFDVDPNAMTITMSPDSRSELLTALKEFAVPHQRHTLHDFQEIGGWCNWSFNVFPLLRPGLSRLFNKMAGRTDSDDVYTSEDLCRELWWLIGHMEKLDGVRMLESEEWGPADANVTFYSDASPGGMGFWCSLGNDHRGFQHKIVDPSHELAFYKALSVLSALNFALSRLRPLPRRISIFTEDTDTVDMFNTLKAAPQYNPILLTAVDMLLSHNAQMRVYHISGDQNSTANSLSRLDKKATSTSLRDIAISEFEPPQLTSGVDIPETIVQLRG